MWNWFESNQIREKDGFAVINDACSFGFFHTKIIDYYTGEEHYSAISQLMKPEILIKGKPL